jgi:hypothetical protein
VASIEVRGKEKLTRLADVLAAHGEGKSIRRRLSKTIRSEAEDVTKDQRANLAARMPHRGGLAARLSGEGRFTVRTALAGRSVGVTLTDSWKGHDMKAVDRGLIRHPVWGRWLRGQAPQRVPAQTLTKPFLMHRRRLQLAIVRDLDVLAAEIAKET